MGGGDSFSIRKTNNGMAEEGHKQIGEKREGEADDDRYE